MQFTRREEKLVKSRKTALRAFRKKVEKKNRHPDNAPPPPLQLQGKCDVMSRNATFSKPMGILVL